MSTEKALTTPVDTAAGIVAVIERANQLLDYDETTGVLRWRVTRGRQAKAGDIAGTIIQGRRYVKICGRSYLAHRLIFAIKTGRLPSGEIDHIDGNPDNNAWCNLRECTHSQNGQNRKVSKANKSGLIGVSKHGNGWQATICVNKVYRHLGRFKTPEEAHAAYVAAKRELHTFNPEVRYA